MKATSKLISVVLILAMCLSLFTVSAFADGQVIIGETNPTSGNQTMNTWVGANRSTQAQVVTDDVYQGSDDEVVQQSAAPAAPVADPAVKEPVKVNDAAALLAAVKAGGKVVLGSSFAVSETLEPAAGTELDLAGNTLTFANDAAAKAAALVVASGNVTVKNGNLVVNGRQMIDATGNYVKSGFDAVAESAGSLVLSGVGVVLNNDAAASMFSGKVGLVYGSYNRDVTNYFDAETFDMVLNDNGVYVLKDKAAEEPAAPAAAEEPVEPAAPAEGEGTEPVEGEGTEPAEGEGTEPVEGAEGDVVDETPVNVVEEEEKVLESEVRVSEEEEANQDDIVTLEPVTEPVTGAVVIVSGKNLPKDLTVVVKPLSTENIGGLEENERALLALDISLVDADGNEYEPKDDPNVGAVSVQIKHASLGNLEEDESLKLYHVVDDVAQTVGSASQSAEDTLDFATGSFSPFIITANTGDGTANTGSTGEVHKKVIKITNVTGDIYVKGQPEKLVFKIEGGAIPESISVIDPDNVSSGNADVYRAGYMIYDEKTVSNLDSTGTFYDYVVTKDAAGTTVADPSAASIADPVYVTFSKKALENAPTGKWAFVFWFKDTTDAGSTRVYMVQYITIVPTLEIKAVSPLDEYGDIYFEKCDYEPVEIFLTADLKSFAIKDASGKVVASYDYNTDKKKVYVNTKKFPSKSYAASEMFTVSDFMQYDAVGHEFIAGKTLQLSKSLIEKLEFGNYTIDVSQENIGKTPSNAFTKNGMKMTIVPGIAVADGLNDYIKGKNVWIKFVACAPIDYDEDGTLAIWIGGQKISHDYYSISNDHQTLWIYRNLLDQLRSNNSYTLTARLWRLNPVTGVKETFYPANAQFNILAAGSTSYKSPKTGDNSNVALWAAVLVLSGGAVVALIPKKKRASK